ncbi:MAG: NAD(P)/FAD-dependent oxidoreductase [Anaerolineae bacterium]|nr:NAD(P)/FAD-dependent oxidoreductase [Anaerolineae bacterium]
MKTLLILGAGTGGTMVANKMSQQLDSKEWKIIIVDKDETHYYQPGFLFIPFGIYSPDEVVKPKRDFIPPNVELVLSDIEVIEPEKSRVKLTKNKRVIQYDQLVIATGSHIHPEETEGMVDGGWQKNIFDFYSLDGASKLHNFLKYWKGGRMVLNVAEMPIKCPVAPLEFLFLADWFFHERGLRDKVEIVFTTPLPGAFTKPRASAILGDFLEQKGVYLETDFNIMEVDAGANKIRSYDEREIDYDLLVTIPTNMGADVIERSKMGDELNFVPTDKHTLRSDGWENVWIIGDAGNVPASKAGSVAHFMLDIVVENILRAIEGLEPRADFDGHANCFIESGFEKGILIDFNYDVEPLPGKFPLPGFGPFSLLEESAANHWGKMMFRWMYWNILLKGGEMPFESQMSMAGKWA